MDIYGNPALGRRVQRKDMRSREKVTGATARALSGMSSEPEFRAGLRKYCGVIKKRVQMVAAHGGRISTSLLAEAWVWPDGGA